MYRKIRLFLITAILSIAAIGLVSSRLISRAENNETGNKLRAYRLTRPDPYRDSPYWSTDFVLAWDHVGERLSISGYWITNEYHDQYYNFGPDGERRTVGQPTRSDRTIWLFGNSGTQDPFVPDAYTASSQLQALLNRHGYIWRVVNLSAGGQKASGELAWMKDAPIQPGDLVVMIDGAMDVTDPIRYSQVVGQSEQYAAQIGATYYHFVQPYIDPAWCVQMGGPRLFVPSAMFIDSAHMNEHGDQIVALAIFDAITRF